MNGNRKFHGVAKMIEHSLHRPTVLLQGTFNFDIFVTQLIYVLEGNYSEE